MSLVNTNSDMEQKTLKKKLKPSVKPEMSLDGPPLDYSFKQISDLIQIKQQEPRNSQETKAFRKPIEIEKEEEVEANQDKKSEEQDDKVNEDA